MDRAVVLTGTINTSVYNNVGNIIKNIEERKKQYYDSIEKYIKESVFTKIIFIKNSNFDFDEEYFKQLACFHNKQFEFIKGKICKSEIIKHGKSFGDAYLFQQAIEESKLLKSEKKVFKITGRIYLTNSEKIVKDSEKWNNQFIVYETKEWALTNIFKCDLKDYQKYLYNIFDDCDEKSGWDIERCFYKRLKDIVGLIQIGSFKTYPFFIGYQGANGKLYTKPGMDYLLRNILIKLGVFTMESKAQIILKILFPVYYKITKKYKNSKIS